MKPATSFYRWRTSMGTRRCTKRSPPTETRTNRHTSKMPVSMLTASLLFLLIGFYMRSKIHLQP